MPYLVMRKRGGCMTAVKTLKEEKGMGSMTSTQTAFSRPSLEVAEWEDILAWVAMVATIFSLEELPVLRVSPSSLVELCIH